MIGNNLYVNLLLAVDEVSLEWSPD